MKARKPDIANVLRVRVKITILPTLNCFTFIYVRLVCRCPSSRLSSWHSLFSRTIFNFDASFVLSARFR